MRGERSQDVPRQLRQVIRPEEIAGVSDVQLLRRWAAQRDEAAFEVLMWRHGPMVLDVCRRILRDGHRAEDAFQATFLTLTRKAGSIGNAEALAGWLYRVAYRVALLARAHAAKEPALAPGLESLVQAPDEDHLWRDVCGVLDEEIARLPERYRVPLILCYFEGKTHEQVGHELCCPAGTIASRLSRARARLQARLTRRGIALTALALTGLLSERALASLVPSGLVTSTRQYGCLLLSDPSPAGIPANVHVLLNGAIKMMTMLKMKMAAIVMVTLLLCGSGVGTLVYRLSAGQPSAVVEAGVLGDDDPLSRDLKSLQGKWQMIHAGAKRQLRSVKEISGNRETLRRYDAATNKLISESTVEFKLSCSGDVRVFTFYPVGGDPKKGQSFVYKVDGDNFYDIPGLLQGNNYRNYQASPTIWHWKRLKEEAKETHPD